MNDDDMTSNRPYFIRALYEWIVDNHLTPHLMVDATLPSVLVPEKYINKEGKIVLNIQPDAIENLVMNNHWVTFTARFSGVARDIQLPVRAIEAVYAVENGRGMVFEDEPFDDDLPPPPDDTPEGTAKKPGKPSLKIVK